MATIISIIISCLSIGIILSAPMGPIGILCVQRTINHGRMRGLHTGIGAAISDLVYCLLTGLGFSIVIDFIQTNQNLLQIVGSVILFIYALYMMVHNPVSNKSRHIEDTEAAKDNVTHDIVTGFLFTLSNPLIVFLIFPLFARFNFPSPDYSFYHIIIGYIFIVAGALLWWYAITKIVDVLRSRVNMGSMMLINRIMGGIIMLLSLYGFITGAIEYFGL